MRRHRLRFILVLTALLAITLAGCGGDTDDSGEGDDTATTSAPSGTTGAEESTDATAAAGGTSVTIANFAFAPASLDVAAGSEVTVTNNDDATHTLTADDGSFDSGALEKGQSGSITLSAPGEFGYHCNIHGSMKGTIRVTA